MGVLRLEPMDLGADPGLQPDVDVSSFAAQVAWAIEEFTGEGDVILDPFAGFGTTLRVAERLGREGFGIELVDERAEWARAQLEHPERLLRGDARTLNELDGLPARGTVALCIGSPPFTGEWDPQDPLNAYSADGPGYAAYLTGLGAIYDAVVPLLRADPPGVVAVSLAHVHQEKRATPLTWDAGRALTRSGWLWFVDEVVVEEPHGGWSSLVLYRAAT
jgi:hypothetical protein